MKSPAFFCNGGNMYKSVTHTGSDPHIRMNKLCTNNAVTSNNIAFVLRQGISRWAGGRCRHWYIFQNTGGLHFCYTENKKYWSAKIRIASPFKITFAVNKLNVIYFLKNQ